MPTDLPKLTAGSRLARAGARRERGTGRCWICHEPTEMPDRVYLQGIFICRVCDDRDFPGEERGKIFGYGSAAYQTARTTD